MINLNHKRYWPVHSYVNNRCRSCVFSQKTDAPHLIACNNPDLEMTGDEVGAIQGNFNYPDWFDPFWMTKKCKNRQATDGKKISVTVIAKMFANKTPERILQVLREEGTAMTKREIAILVGGSYRKTEVQIPSLEKQGLLEKCGHKEVVYKYGNMVHRRKANLYKLKEE